MQGVILGQAEDAVPWQQGGAAVGDDELCIAGDAPRRAVTGVWTLRTPLLWLAGCSVLVVRGPGVQLFLPGVDALQAQALAAVLMEDTP